MARAYAADPERVKDAVRKYKAANPEKVKASQKTWRDARPEEVRLRNAAAWSFRDREKIRGQHRVWRASQNPEEHQAYMRRYRGVKDAERVPDVFTLQGACCAICQSAQPSVGSKGWHADHDHSTGLLRGVLCAHCNTALGLFKDSVPALLKAVDYLRNPPASLRNP